MFSARLFEAVEIETLIEMSSRPYFLLETFNGESGNWDQWIDHFERVAIVNSWELNADKLKWLCVKLTTQALMALKRIPKVTHDNYDNCKKALKKQYE